MRAFCPQCKAQVSVVMVLADDVARRELAENKPVEVIHVTPRGDHHVWMVVEDDLTENRRRPVSELSDSVDDAVVNWLAQKPMRLVELAEASHCNPSHLRASFKRLLRARKVRRFRKNRGLFYSIADGVREI
jgi:hypothetical protein